MCRKNQWDTNYYRFENIIKGISRSFLGSSLYTFNFSKCGIDEEKARKTLDEYGLKNVGLIEETN